MAHHKPVIAVLSALATCAVLSMASDAKALSTSCKIDAIEIHADYVKAHCDEDGNWYWMFRSWYSAEHFDLTMRILQIGMLSEKKIKFNDIGQYGNTASNRKYDYLRIDSP